MAWKMYTLYLIQSFNKPFLENQVIEKDNEKIVINYYISDLNKTFGSKEVSK